MIAPDAGLPLISKLIQLYVRSGARGSTRSTFLLARHLRSLQAVPITINGRRLFVDLRDGLSHALLAGSPWPTVPWEKDEQLIMRRLVRPGDVVFDVGAHIGVHMVLLSELATPRGCVHAFEPNPAKIPTLRRTAGVCHNTTVHAFGLSHSERQATLFVPVDESMASLRDWTSGRVGAVREVPCAGSGNSDTLPSENSDASDSGNSGRFELSPSGHRLAASSSGGRDDRHAQAAPDPGTSRGGPQSAGGRAARRRLPSKRATGRH